jgi:hypothetical protein
VVVVERITAAKTPRVPFTTIEVPASSPSRYNSSPANSNVSPVPKKGIKIAKKINGISIKARLNRRRIGIRLTAAAATKRRKKARNAGHRVIGVDTDTEIKAKTARIFRCAGRECVTEWRWM